MSKYYITRECTYDTLDKILTDYTECGYELVQAIQQKSGDAYKLIFRRP